MCKEIDILEQDWDNLLILDGCRYDYFKTVYSDYLSGELRRIKSKAFETTQWLRKTFGGERHDDIVYVSANPYVNSLGIEKDKFDGRGVFHKIIDVWNWGWNEDLKTVHPKTVNKAARKAKMYFPGKRLVIHYMQPHYPFLSLDSEIGLPNPNERDGKSEDGNIISNIASSIHVAILRNRWARIFWLFRKLKIYMDLADPHAVELIARKVGDKDLREAYLDNLKIALKQVSRLVEKLPGKNVVSADHGYLLGENGEYAHESFRTPSLLFKVPWLEVS